MGYSVDWDKPSWKVDSEFYIGPHRVEGMFLAKRRWHCSWNICSTNICSKCISRRILSILVSPLLLDSWSLSSAVYKMPPAFWGPWRGYLLNRIGTDQLPLFVSSQASTACSFLHAVRFLFPADLIERSQERGEKQKHEASVVHYFNMHSKRIRDVGYRGNFPPIFLDESRKIDSF